MNSEEFLHVKYVDILQRTKKVINKFSLMIGIGLGLVFFFLFLDYALAFWYGA